MLLIPNPWKTVWIPFSINSRRGELPFLNRNRDCNTRSVPCPISKSCQWQMLRKKSNRELRWSNKFYLGSCDGGCTNNYGKLVLVQMGSCDKTGGHQYLKCRHLWENQEGHLCPRVAPNVKKCQNREVLMMVYYFIVIPMHGSLNLSGGQERWQNHWKRLVQHQSWKTEIFVDLGPAEGVSQAWRGSVAIPSLPSLHFSRVSSGIRHLDALGAAQTPMGARGLQLQFAHF